jgi:hypothetical protein
VSSEIADVLTAALLFGGLVLALEAGCRAGLRSARKEGEKSGGQIGAIQGALFGLLGLLLAFSFAGAATRYLERQDLIVQEANAIGTSFLRADMLAEEHRSALRAALREYTGHRIAVAKRIQRSVDAADLAEVERLQGRIWSAASAGVTDRPASMLAVLEPINDVIDLHSLRMAAGRKHIPVLVMGLLVACSVLSVAVIGYGNGIAGKRHAPLALSLAFLIAAALWITIDLDHPRAGLMRLSDAPLEELKLEAPRG